MENLHFMYPSWLWLLLLIPLLWGLRAWFRPRNGGWESILDKQLMPFVLSGQASSWGVLPLIILSFALFVAVLAMAGPSWEKREVPVFHNQQALVVAMDFSTSMYAEDEKPDRLSLERFKLLDILNARKEGQTGLVVFAGDAFVVSPLTDDTATISEQVKNLTPDVMPAPGSLLTPAIKRAVALFKQAGVPKGNILLLTDGVNDSDEAVNAAADARKQGYPVSVLAIGTEEGAPVPLPRGGFLTDGFGKTVVAVTNTDELASIADAGGGVYAKAGQGDNDLNRISAQWQSETSADLKDGGGRQIDTWLNEGFWLLPVLLPLAALVFRRGWLAAVLLICFVLPQPQQAYATGWEDLWLTPDQQGQQKMQAGNTAEAARLFQNPGWKGAAAYKNKDYISAARQYAGKPDITDQYNYANAMARQGKFDEAIASYENVLKADPAHQDARYNLEIVKKAQQQQQAKNQQQQDQQQNQPSQNQQDKQPGQQGQNGQNKQQQGQNAGQQQNQDKQDDKQKQQESDQEKSEKEKKDKEGKGDKKDQDKQDETQQSVQQREQQQAAEQWLRRIPDDPAGLWRRKFQYQYQQRGTQARGSEW